MWLGYHYHVCDSSLGIMCYGNIGMGAREVREDD